MLEQILIFPKFQKKITPEKYNTEIVVKKDKHIQEQKQKRTIKKQMLRKNNKKKTHWNKTGDTYN